MKICILSSNFPPVYSGGGRLALTLGKEMVRLGNEITVVSRLFKGLSPAEILDGVKVERIPYGSMPWDLKNLLRLLVTRRKHYDVVLFFRPDGGFHYSWLLIPLLHRLGKKCAARMSLLSASGSLGLNSRGFPNLQSLPYRFHDCVISISGALTQSYRELFGNAGRVVQIPNGVETQRFQPLPDAHRKKVLKQELHLDPSLRYCVFCGRPSYRKGLDILIDAWLRIGHEFADCRLLLVGPSRDPYRGVGEDRFLAEIQAKIERSGLSDSVVWTGPTEHVEKYLQVSEIFLFPSRREGCPNALLEAMSCGLPVVCTRIDKITDELVADSVEGFVTSFDPNEFAARAIELLSSPVRIQQFGARGRQRILNDHAIPVIAQKYVESLAQL